MKEATAVFCVLTNEWEGATNEALILEEGPGIRSDGVFSSWYQAVKYFRRYIDNDPAFLEPHSRNIWTCHICNDVRGEGCSECRCESLIDVKLNKGI